MSASLIYHIIKTTFNMLILQTITGEQHRVKDTTYIWWYMLQDQMSIAPLFFLLFIIQNLLNVHFVIN